MQKSKLLLLSFSHMSADINSGALPALLPFLVVAFGYGYAESAFILFCYALIASLVQPVCGWIADCRPSFWYLPFGILSVGLGVGMLGFMPSYAGICAAAILSGIGSAVFHPAAVGYANILAGDKRATGMSIFSVGGNGGFALGPLMVGLLLPVFGLGATAAFGILALLTSLTVWHAFRQMPVPGQRQKAQGKDEARNDWKAFGCLTGVIFSRAVVFNGFNGLVALYWMQRFGADAASAAFMLTLFCGAGVVCNLIGGFVADRVGYVRILRFTQTFMLPATVFFALTDNAWLASFLMFLVSFALYASFSPTVILGQTYLAKNPGFAAGVTMGLARSVGGVAIPILGLIADHWDLQTAFFCLSVATVFGLVAAWRLKHTVYDHA